MDIEGLLWDGQTFSSDFGRLMCALLNATGFDGVPISAAREYLAPPTTVVESFERNHAVMYHMPTRIYRFYSPAHRQAARSMLSCADNNRSRRSRRTHAHGAHRARTRDRRLNKDLNHCPSVCH